MERKRTALGIVLMLLLPLCRFFVVPWSNEQINKNYSLNEAFFVLIFLLPVVSLLFGMGFAFIMDLDTQLSLRSLLIMGCFIPVLYLIFTAAYFVDPNGSLGVFYANYLMGKCSVYFMATGILVNCYFRRISRTNMKSIYF